MARAAVVSLVMCLVGCARSDGARTPASEPAPARPATIPAADPGPSAPKSVPVRSEPVVTPESTQAHQRAQLEVDGVALAEHDLVHFVPVQRAASAPPPLAHFHAALRTLAAGQDPDGKVRVAFYGSSSVAADRYTGYLRHYLQARFGDGGPGFVAAAPLWRWHRHDAVTATASKHWEIEHAQRKSGKLDGRYGLLGASAHTTNKRARAELRAKKTASPVSAIELWYLAQPEGGTATLSVMGKSFVLDTKAEAFGPGYLAAEGIAAGPASITITPRGDGEIRLFGAVLECEGTGVVLDALGVAGTRAANMTLWDEACWVDNLTRRSPDLWVLAYGANEAVDEDEPIADYRANLRAVIDKFRAAAPAASCLLVGPVDFPVEVAVDGQAPAWTERTRCTDIIAMQRQVAAEAGCGFFDEKAMMGGANSMEAWVTAEPPLAKPDHLHFTTLGYSHLGRVLSDAIMADFDDPPAR